MIKVAFLVVDDRFERPLPTPFFGTAPTAVLQGMEALRSELEIHVICCTESLLPSPERLGENILYHGIRVPKLGHLRTLHQGCVRAVSKELKCINPDIVHAQGTERWCAMSAAFSALPKVLTIHGYLREVNRSAPMKPYLYWKLQEALESFSIPRYDGVFCNSRYIQNSIRPFARRTWQVPNALRSAFFEEPSVQKHSQVTLFNVGLVQPRKQQVELAKLGRRLHERGVNCQIRFAGGILDGDPYSQEFLRLCEEGEPLGYLKYIGKLDTDALVKEMDRCHALIHAPIEEAFGLVVAEGLARGLRLFAFDVGGVADIASPILDTNLYPAQDWKALEEGIVNWIHDRAPGTPAAREAIRSAYHPEVIARRHLDIYREVLGRS